MGVGPRDRVIGCRVLGRSDGRTSVLLGGAVGLGPCLLLLRPSASLAASSTDDTSLNGHPLRPPDTASPQATLRSFQEPAREVVRRNRARQPPADVDRAIAKVLVTLNLSGLPAAERMDPGVERATLLLDILGRISLPPLAEKPHYSGSPKVE